MSSACAPEISIGGGIDLNCVSLTTNRPLPPVGDRRHRRLARALVGIYHVQECGSNSSSFVREKRGGDAVVVGSLVDAGNFTQGGLFSLTRKQLWKTAAWRNGGMLLVPNGTATLNCEGNDRTDEECRSLSRATRICELARISTIKAIGKRIHNKIFWERR